MVCFKNWLLAEDLDKFYEKCLTDVLLEQACRETIQIILESENLDDEDGTFDGDIESLKFPEPDQNVKPKEEMPPEPESTQKAAEEISSSIRDAQKKLKDAILVLRWNAISQRAKKIQQVKEMRNKHAAENGIPILENSEEDDDDFKFAQMKARKKFDVMDAVPLLEELGYIKMDDLYEDQLDDEQIKKEVTKKLYAAAEEKGNDLPPDVDDEFLQDKVAGVTRLQKATNDFFLATRDVFANKFKSIARSSANRVSIPGKEKKKGYRLYDPGESGNEAINDIANKFAVKMLETFTKRGFSSSRTQPEPWLSLKKDKKDINFGKVGKEEMNNDNLVEDIIRYISTHLKEFYSNEEREVKLANAPSRPTQDIEVWGGNRDKKANLINTDIETNNLDFYKKYMSASDSDREKMDARLDELKTKKGLSQEETEEKWRLEILQQIFFLHSMHSSSLSLDPQNIVSTLQFYRGNFLGKKYRAQSFFGSMGKKSDSGGEGDLFKYDPDLITKSSDSSSPRDAASGSFPNPASAAAQQEAKEILHKKLLAALEALRISSKSGANYALALCVMWELGNCRPGTAINNVAKFSDLMIPLNKDGSIKGGNQASSCKDHLKQLLPGSGNYGGKTFKQITDELGMILGQEQSEVTVRSWVEKGIDFICNHMQAGSLPRSWDPSARRFDSSRPSPLSTRTTSSGKARLVTDPVTGKRHFVVEK